MMASDPFSRPSIGQLFKHKRLRIMELFEPAVRLKNRLVSNVNGELVILYQSELIVWVWSVGMVTM